MKKPLRLLSALLLVLSAAARPAAAQDTFSIVAVDSVTGEVGSAGASCVNSSILLSWGYAPGFLGTLVPGVGAINTQASYVVANQNNARARMLAGDTPAQIIAWLQANDAGNNPNIRQYGVVALGNGHPAAAAYTGANCLDWKGHRTGRNYAIQGNILLGPQIVDSMEARFLRTPGPLSARLMAALQGAKVPGADTRCAANNSSSLFAFLKVARPADDPNAPYLSLGLMTANGDSIEPIDSLQALYNAWTLVNARPEQSGPLSVQVYPNPAEGGLVTVALPEAAPGPLNCQVYNALGQLVFCSAGPVRERLQIPLPRGLYIIRVHTPDGSRSFTGRAVVR